MIKKSIVSRVFENTMRAPSPNEERSAALLADLLMFACTPPVGRKPQPGMSASSAKPIMSGKTAKDENAAATMPPSVGPTMMLTLESVAMTELIFLSSTGSPVR